MSENTTTQRTLLGIEERKVLYVVIVMMGGISGAAAAMASDYPNIVKWGLGLEMVVIFIWAFAFGQRWAK